MKVFEPEKKREATELPRVTFGQRDKRERQLRCSERQSAFGFTEVRLRRKGIKGRGASGADPQRAKGLFYSQSLSPLAALGESVSAPSGRQRG